VKYNIGMSEEIIPILRVRDAVGAAVWYRRLGFVKEWEHRFEPGLPAFVCVVRGNLRLFLSEHTGDAQPSALVYLRLADLPSIASEFGAPVHVQPWGDETELTHLDGNRLRIGAVKPSPV